MGGRPNPARAAQGPHLEEEGTVAFWQGEEVRWPGKKVPVADIVSAGDSFAVGLLAGLLR